MKVVYVLPISWGGIPHCTAELADVSCGDPWLPEVLANEKLGKSIVIYRTEVGEALCLEAVQNGHIGIEKIDSGKVKQSGNMMQTKNKDMQVRFLIRRMFNKNTPIYNTTLLQPGLANYLCGAVVYFNAWTASKRYLRRFIGTLSHIGLLLMSCLRRVR